MRKVLLLLLFVLPAFAAPKKSIPKKHVSTEAEQCWKSVQQIALLDLDKEAVHFDSLSSLTMRLNVCSETLKADKFKSAVASKLNELLLTLRDKNNLRDLNQGLQRDYQAQIVSSAEAMQKQKETTKVLLSAYSALDADYKKHLENDILLASRLRDSIPAAPQYQQQRGFFANVLQSMGDAAAAQAARQTIHCETEYVGNYAYTDCR